MTSHRFSSPLARDLFALGVDAMQAQLAEANQGVPVVEFSEEDQKRLAAIHAQEEIFTEGRQHRRPFRINPHGE